MAIPPAVRRQSRRDRAPYRPGRAAPEYRDRRRRLVGRHRERRGAARRSRRGDRAWAGVEILSRRTPGRPRGPCDRLRCAASRLRLPFRTRYPAASVRTARHRLRRPRGGDDRGAGDKISARSLARAAGVPLVAGSDNVASAADAARIADEIGYPVLLKASAGGGGRGMVIAHNRAEVETGFARASAEAQAAFNDGTLFLERFVPRARHVEVQLMGDGRGKVVHFGERDCSVQRRYQKLIEEAPSVAMPQALRSGSMRRPPRSPRASTIAAPAPPSSSRRHIAARFPSWRSMRRIQVEHPVSEQVTGADLIQWQLRIAGGEPLDLAQDDIKVSGHAIECRINAEDPMLDFRPSPAASRAGRRQRARASASTRIWGRARRSRPSTTA